MNLKIMFINHWKQLKHTGSWHLISFFIQTYFKSRKKTITISLLNFTLKIQI